MENIQMSANKLADAKFKHELLVINYLKNNLPRVLKEYYGYEEGQSVINYKGEKQIIRLDSSFLEKRINFYHVDLINHLELEMVSFLFCDYLSMGDDLCVKGINGNREKTIYECLLKNEPILNILEPRIYLYENQQLNFLARL